MRVSVTLPQLSPAVNAVAASAPSEPMPAGWIHSLIARNVGTGTVPNGAYEYASVHLLRNIGRAATPTDRDVRATLLSGYLRAGVSPTSLPGVYVEQDQRLTANVVRGSHATDADVGPVEIEAIIDTERPPATSIMRERPGAVPGLIRTITTADPATGTDPADITVPNYVRWRPLSVRVDLTAAVTVASRRLRIDWRQGGAARIASTMPNAAFTSSGAGAFAAAIGGPIGTNDNAPAITFPLPDWLMEPGDTLDFITQNLQAGDEYDALALTVEEWPWP